MALQEDGWPLGLQRLNARISLVRNHHHDRHGSISFSTLVTGSPTSSTDSSSSTNFDSESTGSFFRENSITLGSLIGISSILELSRRSMRGRPTESMTSQKKNCKPKPWLFSMCSKLNTDAVVVSNSNNAVPSLGHFLEAERTQRRADTTFRSNNPRLNSYGPDDFSRALHDSEPNSLFISGRIAPPHSPENYSKGGLIEEGDGIGTPLLLSCLCGQITH